MAKKELIIDSADLHERKTLNLVERVESTRLVSALSKIYSDLLEEQISARHTLKLVHAQFAMFFLLLLGGVSFILTTLLCVWAVLAVWQCKI